MSQALILQGNAEVYNAPAYTDFAAYFTADPRVIGVWRFNDPYITAVSGLVTSVANLKNGGPALASVGGNSAGMVFDPILNRNVLSLVPAVPADYQVNWNMASYASGFTMEAFFRPKAEAHYSNFTYLMSTDGTWPLIQRGDRSASPQYLPILDAALYDPADGTGATLSKAAVTVDDPYGWLSEQITFDASKNLKMSINNGLQSTTTATTITPGTTTKFKIGSATGARMPTANLDCVALFGVDLNSPNNADLRKVWDDFRSEAFR